MSFIVFSKSIHPVVSQYEAWLNHQEFPPFFARLWLAETAFPGVYLSQSEVTANGLQQTEEWVDCKQLRGLLRILANEMAR